MTRVVAQPLHLPWGEVAARSAAGEGVYLIESPRPPHPNPSDLIAYISKNPMFSNSSRFLSPMRSQRFQIGSIKLTVSLVFFPSALSVANLGFGMSVGRSPRRLNFTPLPV